MSFREKVKELLETGRDANEFRRKSAKLVAREAQARIEAAQKAASTKAKEEDAADPFSLVGKSKPKKATKKKSKKKTTVTMPKGTIKVDGKTRMSPHAIARKAARVAAAKKSKPESKPESTTENSNHPFYQKVKALSRGKKNNSLLEKKSNSIKTFKILLGTVGKKSKMDEAKKKSKQEIEIEVEAERQRRMQVYGTTDVPDLPDLPMQSKPEVDKKKKPTKKPRSKTGRMADNLGLGNLWPD